MAGTYRRASRANLHRAAPYDGVPALLEACRARGLALGLLTGKDRARTEEVLGLFRLRETFQLVVCGDDPLGARPDRAALVGDSPQDMDCARAAGAGALGAGWGFTRALDLRASAAGLVFHSPWELCAWLQASAARDLPENDARGASHG